MALLPPREGLSLHKVKPDTAPKSMVASAITNSTAIRSIVAPGAGTTPSYGQGSQSPEANAAKDLAKKAAFPVGGAVVAAGTGALAGLALPIVGALGAAGAAIGWFVGKKAQHQ